ncbi:uncharacterized protein METZ01_LOCUS508691 [marine metagenome]|uniref:Uncharacterized protein n=1 Tax=marine metagenome TaxID=408172 RepID=A0A383EG55_9ZZZZ
MKKLLGIMALDLLLNTKANSAISVGLKK